MSSKKNSELKAQADCLTALKAYWDKDSPVYQKAFYRVWLEENFSEKELAAADKERKKTIVSSEISRLTGRRIEPPPYQFDSTYRRHKKKEPIIKHRGRRALPTHDEIARRIQKGESTHLLDPDEYIHHPYLNKKKRIRDYEVTTSRRGGKTSVHADLIRKYLNELEK